MKILFFALIITAFGAPMHAESTLSELRNRAVSGDPVAELNVGLAYYNGSDGAQQNFQEAAVWLRKAADQNNCGAQFLLGRMYMVGEGVPVNYTESLRLMRKLAESGHAASQAQLGIFYEHGYGVAIDYNEAAKWYRKAADAGSGLGCAN